MIFLSLLRNDDLVQFFLFFFKFNCWTSRGIWVLSITSYRKPPGHFKQGSCFKLSSRWLITRTFYILDFCQSIICLLTLKKLRAAWSKSLLKMGTNTLVWTLFKVINCLNDIQRRIQSPVKYLRWCFLRK